MDHLPAAGGTVRRDCDEPVAAAAAFSERPDQWGEDHGCDPHQQVQWDADLQVVGEAVAAGAVDHQIRLVAAWPLCAYSQGGSFS